MIYVYFHYSSSLKRNGQPLNCHHVLLRTIIKYTKNCCKHLPQEIHVHIAILKWTVLAFLFEFVYKTDMCWLSLNNEWTLNNISTCIFQTLKYLLRILKFHHCCLTSTCNVWTFLHAERIRNIHNSRIPKTPVSILYDHRFLHWTMKSSLCSSGCVVVCVYVRA